ncbi:hypothetical protein B0A69_05290 [Chryseobacterium shigense]|uniref:Uncharacterized protein n=1 Tax=Chryseobacterium shigense TaxID=297244 RepID=A0A1N7ILW7_9FLAO|nr:hypothetical protein [Chryseobacterium shigense]PQA95785.1 hypothetical protein B0A69_05290 [Chryseobacterium shigense]SIS38052.1 hypothetical protein SAMN05421639_104206 [Chryseobacterium shigense]
MKITTPKGRIIEFQQGTENWQSREYITDHHGVQSKIPVFIFEDLFYREYSETMDFENDLRQLIDFYLDHQERILSQTRMAVDPMIIHNHDMGKDEVNYIINHIEITGLSRYEFKIDFVFLYGYVYYTISYLFLSPENFIVTKIERSYNY